MWQVIKYVFSMALKRRKWFSIKDLKADKKCHFNKLEFVDDNVGRTG